MHYRKCIIYESSFVNSIIEHISFPPKFTNCTILDNSNNNDKNINKINKKKT